MSTAAPDCQHCFCLITTGGDLKCHRCGVIKPYEPPKQYTCFMCNGTGKVYQIRQHEDCFDIGDVL